MSLDFLGAGGSVSFAPIQPGPGVGFSGANQVGLLRKSAIGSVPISKI